MSRSRFSSGLEEVDHFFRKRGIEAAFHLKPAPALPWNSQALGIGRKRAEHRARLAGAREDDALALGGALDELREMGFCLGDIYGVLRHDTWMIAEVTKLVKPCERRSSTSGRARQMRRRDSRGSGVDSDKVRDLHPEVTNLVLT